MARPLAGPPIRYADSGISSAVTKLETINITLMISAALASNFRCFGCGLRAEFPARPLSPRINGMTETPVSNPLSPRQAWKDEPGSNRD